MRTSIDDWPLDRVTCDALLAVAEAASWYQKCRDNIKRRVPVRGMDEAREGLRSALAKFDSKSEAVDDAAAVRGVAIVGRPMARMTDQHGVVEAIRVATDGCPNACSALYGAVCRQQRAHGYRKAITFILASEPGTSLRAAGWRPVARTDGGSWSRPSRHREDDHPLDPKVRWECSCSELPEMK